MAACLSFRISGSGRRGMRGVAAIEFAFVALVFCFMLYGVATFGAAYYTQQVISRAAEDGVRASLLFNNVVANDPRVQNVVYQSLSTSLIAPLDASGTQEARLQWLRGAVDPPLVNIATPGRVTVQVQYPYQRNPVIPPIPLSQGIVIPDLLTGRATAAKPET